MKRAANALCESGDVSPVTAEPSGERKSNELVGGHLAGADCYWGISINPRELCWEGLLGQGRAITGWASGVGCATPAAIVKDGAKVAVVDSGGETWVSGARRLVSTAPFVHFDSLVPESIEALIMQSVDW